MITKICKKCGGELPADTGFYVNDNTCKDCRKKRVRENRKEKINQYKEYEKRRAMLPHRVEARKKYSESERGKEVIKKITKKWKAKNQKKRSAHNIVNNYVRDGKISKPKECESCGRSKCTIHGHHEDYDKPLDVKWLCGKCHNDWHAKYGEGKNP